VRSSSASFGVRAFGERSASVRTSSRTAVWRRCQAALRVGPWPTPYGWVTVTPPGVMLPPMADALTTGQVAERMGVVMPGMVRRYAVALETITGISIPADGVRGRLYPLGVR